MLLLLILLYFKTLHLRLLFLLSPLLLLLALPSPLAVEQSPLKVTSEVEINQQTDTTSAQLDLQSVTHLSNTKSSTETATHSPSGDEQDLNKSPSTPKQGTETATLIEEDNNMCLELPLVNATDSSCGKIKVLDPNNDIELSKKVVGGASTDANGMVSATSSHTVNLPMDEVFAFSPPLFVPGSSTTGPSFASDDDLVHRTRGGRLLKPSLKGTEFEWTLVGRRGKRGRGRGPKH